MKIELNLPQELYDDLIVCAEYKKLELHEYLIVAIGMKVSHDLKAIFVSEEIELADD